MKRPFRSIDFRTLLVACCDFLSLEAVLFAGYWLWVTFPWHGNYQPFSDFSLILWILPPIGIIVFKSLGLYKPEGGILGVEEQSLILKGIWILYITIFAISFFYRHVHFSRLAVFYSIFLAILLVSAERFFIRRIFGWLNEQGIGVRNAIIYGAGYHGQRLERWVRQSPKLGIRIVGYLDDEIERLIKRPETQHLGGIAELKKIARSKNIALLFIAHRTLDEAKTVEIFQLCRELDIQCWAIPSFYQFHIERAELSNIGGIPLMGFRRSFGRGPYLWIKRIFDIAVASFLFLIAAPFLCFIALMIRLISSEPVLFRQARVGQGGRRFTVLKFRTLKSAGRKDEISPELRRARAHFLPLGKFLRRTGLDELPQLWNVLKGEMSLIGPRPEMPFIAEKYGPLERERLRVKPGITGLWQISGDRKRLLIHENMDYDLYYVEHLSFNLDLAILMKTAFTVMARFFEKEKD